MFEAQRNVNSARHGVSGSVKSGKSKCKLLTVIYRSIRFTGLETRPDRVMTGAAGSECLTGCLG